jgi:hypothetical protein
MLCQLGLWYYALFTHLFWHVFDRRVALIFWLFMIIFSSYIRMERLSFRGILTSLYGLFRGGIGFHNTTRPQGAMCLWPVLSALCCSAHHNSNPVYSRKVTGL